MDNALKGGYDVFKKIGLFMGKVFKEIDAVDIEKNIIMFAHYEEFKSSNADGMSFRYKTVGKMVNLCHYLSNCWKLLRATQTTMMEKSHHECLTIV
jgi:hypothetical protein